MNSTCETAERGFEEGRFSMSKSLGSKSFGYAAQIATRPLAPFTFERR
jgi:hypothetical protein